MTPNKFTYVGGELSVFAEAHRWKRYVASQVAPFLRGRVLEVGAGMGTATLALWNANVSSWMSLEPDAELSQKAVQNYAAAGLARVVVRTETAAALGQDELFDAILYMDVLEHIDNDEAEVASVVKHLTAGGHLIVVAPAHQWLYSPFDAAIGHCRRYDAASLRRTTPHSVTEVRMRYLDAVGVAASLVNKLLLRSRAPSHTQIRIWDSVMVPISRAVDPVLAYAVGKSLLGVWRRD